MRIAIFGASGFVGTRVVERQLEHGRACFPIIHSSGSAWRLARHGQPLAVADILSRSDVSRALQGCTHVVNCSRGPDDVMLKGLGNLLTEARNAGVQRFVHISSVAVYGDPPPAESERESCEPNPEKDSYGYTKLLQDRMVEKAHKNGLSCAVLCPPNITGLFSSFSQNVVEDIRAGTFALVDGGRAPVNTVDVENLCHAIELACQVPVVDGQRIFVTDGVKVTWGDFVSQLLPLAERKLPIATIERPAQRPEPRPPRLSVLRALKHLVSSDVRAALRKDPLLERIDTGLRGAIARLPRQMESGIRYSIEGPTKVAKVDAESRPTSRYITQQLRGVVHQVERARNVLGYAPIVPFEEGMEAFRVWYRYARAMNCPSWPLARELYDKG